MTQLDLLPPPLDCATALERVYPYLDGQLAAGDDTRMREHLALCDSCRMESEEARTFLAELGRTLRPAAAPQDVRARISAALAQAAAGQPPDTTQARADAG